MPHTLFRFKGSIAVDDEGLARILSILTTGAVTATDAPDDSPAPVVQPVDTSAAAIATAEAKAAPYGWNHLLAISWADELWETQNGRMLHEIPIASGGYATAAQMRVAAGRSVDANYGLTGFTGGVTKRFKTWQARNDTATALTMPVVTDYDPTNTSRQRARGFEIHPDLVPLFGIALEVTKA